MGYKYYDRDERRLQRKLIPLNIFVAILSLVAAVSLMVTPLLTIDFGEAMSVMTEMAGEDGGESGVEGGAAEGNEMMKAMTDGIDAKISITPLGMAQIAFAEQDKKAEALFDMFIFDTGLVENAMVTMVNVVIVETAELSGVEGINYGELNNALEKMNDAKSEAQFTGAVNEYIQKLESQTNSKLDDEVKTEINDMCVQMYNDTVNEVGEDKFSLEAMICTFVSKDMQDNGVDVNVSTYKELFNGIMDGSIALPGEGESGNDMSESLKEARQMLDDYGGFYGYGFYVILFFAGMWAILFLFAFFHMFAKNKRFTMWYVKLFGCYPCILFGVLPFAGKMLLGSLMGETGAMAAAVLGCVSTMTWISGICYLLLWFVSIFWAFPIKRKIRKLRG
ncbi:MAG: hypothetical protein K2L42_02160 [Clostridia bacterium]|nr:hypothetical protein [Clostridia bacterium]